ncbi:hypothetical protein ABIA38_003429 [Embleya sp. AB8]
MSRKAIDASIRAGVRRPLRHQPGPRQHGRRGRLADRMSVPPRFPSKPTPPRPAPAEVLAARVGTMPHICRHRRRPLVPLVEAPPRARPRCTAHTPTYRPEHASRTRNAHPPAPEPGSSRAHVALPTGPRRRAAPAPRWNACAVAGHDRPLPTTMTGASPRPTPAQAFELLPAGNRRFVGPRASPSRGSGRAVTSRRRGRSRADPPGRRCGRPVPGGRRSGAGGWHRGERSGRRGRPRPGPGPAFPRSRGSRPGGR